MSRKVVGGLLALGLVVAALWLVRHRGHGGDAKPRAGERSAAVPTPPAAPTRPREAGAPRGLAPRWSVDVDPEGPLRLEGQVVGPDGKGVGAAEVWLGSTPPRSTKTEDDGGFSFDRLAGRSYTLSAVRGELFGGPVRYKLTEHGDPVVLRLAEAAAVLVTVVDEARQPIADAEVKLADLAERTARTTGKGTARLAPIHPGWVMVEVSAAGYAPGGGFTTVGSAGATGELTITLHKGFAVSGRVVDDAGKPIANARVSENDGLRGEVRETTGVTTDGKGGFTIAALASGSHTLVAVDGEHAPAQSPPITVSGKPVANVEIRMKPGGRVAGTVVDAAHKPVAFATVRIAGANQQFWQTTARQATGDGKGAFELRGLARIRLQARAESDTAASKLVEVDLSDKPERTDVELMLDIGGTIAGTVVDDHGAPVPEIQVNAFPDVLGGASTDGLVLAGMSSATTGGGGEFLIHGLPDGAYRLWAARHAGGFGQWGKEATTAKTGDKAVRITLASPGSLVGKVALAGSDLPPKLVTVAVGFQPPTPASDGAFQIKELAPGSYDVTFRGLEFAELIKHDVKIEAGKVTDLGTVTVLRGRKLSGKVVDRSGTPVAGATIKLGATLFSSADAGDRGDGLDALSGVRSVVSDQDGLFTAVGVPAKPTNVMAEHPDRGRSLAVPVPEGEADPPPVTLALRGFGSIAGTVTRQGKPVPNVTVGEASKGGGAQGQFTRTAADGSYALAKVAEGAHVINALQQAMMSMKSASVTVQVTAGQQATANIDIPVGDVTATVQVKPLAGNQVDAAQVFLFAGTVNLTTGRQLLDGVFQSSVQGTKFWLGAGKPAPEFAELVAGDYSICALPITGEMTYMQFQHRLQENLASLKVYCKAAHVTPSPPAQTFEIELPAMTPLPTPSK